jgi:hypothetical protein
MIGWLVLAACNTGGERESFASMVDEGCVPGEQRACSCPGEAPDGVQVCAAAGDHFDPCVGCDAADSDITSTTAPTSTATGTATAAGSSDDGEASSAPATMSTSSTSGAPGSSDGGEVSTSSDDSDGPCAGHCSNDVQDCDEPFTDCGADCPAVPYYTFCDCLFDTPRNGSEICDDSGFDVPADPPPGVLVCIEATGGVVYLATNTAIDTDNAPRCQGWENMDPPQNPWDHLDYIAQVTCDAEQKTVPVDISGYVGETLWFGAHNHPMGGGSGTTACIAVAK